MGGFWAAGTLTPEKDPSRHAQSDVFKILKMRIMFVVCSLNMRAGPDIFWVKIFRKSWFLILGDFFGFDGFIFILHFKM